MSHGNNYYRTMFIHPVLSDFIVEILVRAEDEIWMQT